MSATMAGKGVESRILAEGYGPGAWHGNDMKAALADVTPDLAFWRPAPGRHNIAEIAVHHAYYVRAVRERIAGKGIEPFVFSGDDWFAVDTAATMAWPAIQTLVADQHHALEALVADVEAGRAASTLDDTERFNNVIGIACHAVYHAGQVQLIKALKTSSAAKP